MQAAVSAAVNMGAAAEYRLRKRDFHAGAPPVLRPAIDELELSVAEEDCAFDIDTSRIVVGIADVVGSWPLLRNASGGAGLELAVLQDGEGNDVVRVVLTDGTTRQVEVDVGLSEGAFVEIRSGLSGDELVLVET